MISNITAIASLLTVFVVSSQAQACKIQAVANQTENRLLYLQDAEVNSKLLKNGYQLAPNGADADVRLVVDYAKDFVPTLILVSTGEAIDGKVRNKRTNVYAVRLSDGTMIFNKTLEGHSTANKNRLVNSFLSETRGINLGCSSPQK